jgi:hypothetical protein
MQVMHLRNSMSHLQSQVTELTAITSKLAVSGGAEGGTGVAPPDPIALFNQVPQLPPFHLRCCGFHNKFCV